MPSKNYSWKFMEISCLFRLFLLYNLLFFQIFSWKFVKIRNGTRDEITQKNYHGIRRKVHEISWRKFFLIRLSLSYFFSTKFHVGIPELSWKYFSKENLNLKSYVHEIPCGTSGISLKEDIIRKKKLKKKFHVFPGGNSWNFHGIFLDPELLKLFVGTFFSGTLGDIDVAFIKSHRL